VALLLLGARWIRSADASEAAAGEASGSFAQSPQGASSGGGDFSVTDGTDVVVHVAGAVRRPGVYRLPAGSRVTDAVERAGGAASAGDANAINLAARLADGQQIVVPVKPQAGESAVGQSLPGGAADPDSPISLGSATLEDLDTIDGIGPVTAQDILDYRDEHGGISSIDELNQVSGIGPATMEALRARLQP
jgi:competence protein ComEA